MRSCLYIPRLLPILGLACCLMSSPASAEMPCAYADVLLDAGLHDEARKELKSIASTAAAGPTSSAAARECVAASLQSLTALEYRVNQAKARSAFSYVRELADLGLEADALVALKEALKANPGQTTPDDLEYLSGGKIELWRDVRKFLHAYAIPVGEIVVASFFTWLIVYLIWRWIFARPLLRFDEFSGTNGDNVKALVMAAYQDFGRGRGSSTMRIQGNLDAVTLPGAIQQALPTQLQNAYVQAIPALFEKVFPRRILTLTAEMHDSETQGAGLTIFITGSKGGNASLEIWEAEFSADGKPRTPKSEGDNVDQSGDYASLAEYAAIWLLFTLNGWPSGIRPRPQSLKSHMGTESWRAYALFRAAYTTELAGRKDDARTLYVKALRRDPQLSIAKINLAWLARDDKDQWPFAKQLWEQCVEAEGIDAGLRGHLHEQAYYTARYSLASLAFDDAFEPTSETTVADAQKLATNLVESIEARMKLLAGVRDIRWWPSSARATGSDNEIRQYFARMLPVAQAMLAGIEITLGNIAAGRKLIEALAETTNALPRFHYNLACSYSQWAEKEPARTDEHLENCIKHLRTAYWLDSDVNDTPDEDPSLEFVRAQRNAVYTGIVRPRPEPPAPPSNPLGILTIIGAGSAALLEKQGLNSVASLLKATETREQREALAAKTNKGAGRVLKWALAMELASLKGMELNDVNLLLEAEVRSVKALGEMKTQSLLLALIDSCKTLGRKDVPVASDVDRWIRQAKRAKSDIKK